MDVLRSVLGYRGGGTCTMTNEVHIQVRSFLSLVAKARDHHYVLALSESFQTHSSDIGIRLGGKIEKETRNPRLRGEGETVILFGQKIRQKYLLRRLHSECPIKLLTSPKPISAFFGYYQNFNLELIILLSCIFFASTSHDFSLLRHMQRPTKARITQKFGAVNDNRF
jgi:hypothetical protein